jgi:hypothetical protein
MSEMNEMSCAMLADVAAEFALGVLTGRERAEAIEHLDRCEGCREDVRELMATGEELLGLLPPAEPSPGFETRVLNRLGLLAPGLPAPSALPRAVTIPIVTERGLTERGLAERGPGGKRPSSHRRSTGRRPGGAANRGRQLLATAAVAIAVLGAGIGGWGIRTATAPAMASPLAESQLVAADQHLAGNVYVYREKPHWVYMTVDLDGYANAHVTCEVITTSGKVVPMGSFYLDGHGYNWWSKPIPASFGDGLPRGMQVVADNGAVLAGATFTDQGQAS